MPENSKAYEGKEPFAFVSYAHKDSNIVLPVIQGLQNRGVRVWYDGGLELTDQWLKRIADRLEKCSCVLAFVSRNSADSDNCYKEIHFAVEEKKGIAVVHLDPVEKLNAQTRMQLGPLHALFYDRYPRTEALLDALMKVSALRPCIGGAGDAASAVSGAADYSFWDNPEAWYSRGMQNFQAENYTEAVAWFRKAAEQKHAKAQYQMGVCLEKGLGVTPHLENALMWYWKAKDNGDSRAQPSIAWVEAVLRPKAKEIFDAAGRVYRNGDYAQAADWYRKAARMGYAKAQYALAECYASGDGVKCSCVDAAWWYAKAAERGHAEAQYQLGICCIRGYAAKSGAAEAVKWYGKAAAQGHAEAQYTLGRYYAIGRHVRQDWSKAVFWYRKAAEQGLAHAQYELGECCFEGKGVREDKAEAAEWFCEAASQGYAAAQTSLGYCYRKGLGVNQNEKEALEWYRKAANQGYANAMRNMGLCYEYGWGTLKDLKLALVWYQKAKEKSLSGIDEDISRCKKKRIFPWIK